MACWIFKGRIKIQSIAIGLFLSLLAGAANASDSDLFDLSLEQLLSVEITSAARKSQSLSETAAAVYVITSDAIRSSGARNIPEALRLAPGLQVSRIDGNRWAISARGFNGRFANKLLVMVDGRTVYTPSFAGVYWESLDTLIEDIERIEVVRGPGSSVWGANAVNGVIQIITKPSRMTQGALVTADGDNLGAAAGAFRYGGNVGQDGHFRLFAKVSNRDGNIDEIGLPVNDYYSGTRLGGRYDRDNNDSHLEVTAEVFAEDIGETLLLTEITEPYASRLDAENNVDGFFVNAAWTGRAESGAYALRVFVDDVDRRGALFGERSTTYNADLQWTMNRRGRHEVMVGLGYRRYSFEFLPSLYISLLPVAGSDSLISAFVQDEILFGDGAGRLTLGVKLEQDERLTDDLQIMPTLRASYQLGSNSTIWASATRSIRTPSYADFNVSIDGIGAALPPLSERNPMPLPVTTSFMGSMQTTDETILALESGVRWQVGEKQSIDITVFFNKYDDLRTASLLSPSCEPSGVLVPVDPTCLATASHVNNTLWFANSLEATSHGVEIAGQWAVSDRLRVDANYTFLNAKFDSTPLGGGANLFPNAKNQFSIRSDWRMTTRTLLGLWYRYMDDLGEGNVEDHHNVDLRWSWQPSDDFEFAIVGQQLAESKYVEFLSELGESPPTVIERRIVAQVRWLF